MEAWLHGILVDESTLPLLLWMAVCMGVIVKGADWLVDGAVGLSERLHVPKVIVGATIVSLGTTAPEAAVSVMAAFKGDPGIALGNSVGSIICDTGLIFGVCCLLSPLPADKFVLNRHGWVQFGSGLLLVLCACLFRDSESGKQVIPRFIGVLFIALLVTYLGASVFWAKEHRQLQRTKHGQTPEEIAAKEAGKPIYFEAGMLLTGLAMVVISSGVMITVLEVLCDESHWNVPPGIVAATLVAFGTSLPEFVTAIASIYKGHKELLIGNIIGADVLNVLFVTGAAACAAPLIVEPIFWKLQFPFMIAMLGLFRLFVFISKDTFAQWRGIIFVALYFAYLGLSLAMV